MSRGASIVFGYGIDLGWDDDGYAGRLEEVLDDPIDDEGLTKRLSAAGIEVVIDRYGYEFRGVCLLAKDSVQESMTWTLKVSIPDVRPVPQWRREVAQALDELGWDESGLDDPTWLALVTYG